jgi:hypothetical protein
MNLISDRKNVLDKMLVQYKAQPVGSGYIDIIVHRQNYKEFLKELLQNAFIIENISWWEYCNNEEESEYGSGGPRSIYYPGWFSELSIEQDDLFITLEQINEQFEEVLTSIINIIENKRIVFPDKEIISFRSSAWLTTGFWLKVPDEWKNCL